MSIELFACIDNQWMPGQYFSDFVHGYVNRTDETLTVTAIRLQDKKTGYRETIQRSKPSVLQPGYRLVVLERQVKDLKMHLLDMEYHSSHKYLDHDVAF